MDQYFVVVFVCIALVFVIVVLATNSWSNRDLCKTCVVVQDIKSTPVPTRSGAKKALLIGCNYPGTSYELAGCVNDVENIRDFLVPKGYTVEMLCDDGTTTEQPTSANIVNKMTATVASLQSGDTYFVWYSGHGAQLRNSTSDGGYDECWCPPDTVPTGRYLRDNVLNSIVKQATSGVTIFVGSDSCHSGTVFDLPFMVQESGGRNSNKSMLDAQVVRGRKELDDKFLSRRSGRFNVSSTAREKAQKSKDFMKTVSYTPPKVLPKMVVVRDTKFPVTNARVITLSGCQDYSTSADTRENGENQGAMTWAFLRAYNSTQSFSNLLGSMRSVLKGSGYTQIPQLAFGLSVNPDTTLLNAVI